MGLSVGVGLLMLAGKTIAYLLTNSAAILSDAAESVLHLAAVSFAAFSLWLGSRPATQGSPYGYERISFLSAGFEGGMILVAALWIIVAALEKWRAGLHLEQLGLGTLLTLAASGINLALGWYLLSAGRRTRSLVLAANGQHVLTDSWTSFGVVAGLVLVMVTGWKPFDPILAIAVALNIIWSAVRLMRTSIRGLLDLPDPARAAQIASAVAAIASELGLGHHRLRFRDTGHRTIVSVHLLFAGHLSLGEAHRLATQFEQRLAGQLDFPVEVASHLEAREDHCHLHPEELPHWDH
jgi:cation diffusion facilitator family transporter